jgi:hypothetical protein
MDQKEILLKDPVNALENSRNPFLDRGTYFQEKGIKKIKPPFLFHFVGHQDESSENEEEDDKTGERELTKVIKTSNPH